MAAEGAEQDFFNQLDQETDAFFEQLLSEAGVGNQPDSSFIGPDLGVGKAPGSVDGEEARAVASLAASSAAGSAAGGVSGTSRSGGGSADTSAVASAAAREAASRFANTAVGPGSTGQGEPVDAACAVLDLRVAIAVDREDTSLARKLQGESQPHAQTQDGQTGTAEVITFDLDNASHDVTEDTDALRCPYVQDYRPPEVPPPPADFSSEDLALRQALVDFYMLHRPENLANVNVIVAKYRGRSTATLWAQLITKYRLPAMEGVEMLTKTIYLSAPFEYADESQAALLEEALSQLKSTASSSTSGCDKAWLLQRSLQQGADDGSDALLRILCFRGIPDDDGMALRAQMWKILLGYLPMARNSDWNAIQGEKRALYSSYKREMLLVSDEHRVSFLHDGHPSAAIHASRELLQEIQNDVDRTRREFEYFHRPQTRASLVSLLFVYARLNPGVRYVQGMNEVAAVLLYVMSLDAVNAEADSFWCFSELMAEIKEGFMQALDHSDAGVYATVEAVNRILRSYDPDLSRHLQKSELSLFVFVLRWSTVLFAQDATLPDTMRFWDSFIADPRRFELVIYMCLALILGKRDELLSTNHPFSLAEVLQAAPRGADMEVLLRRAYAICAFERRRQPPAFPPPPKSQVVEDLAEWAQTAATRAQEAAAKAQEVGAEVSRTIQETIGPKVYEGAGLASDSAQALQAWLQETLHETAPTRREVLEQAQTHLTSFWQTVRATSAAAVTSGQRLAADLSQNEVSQAVRFPSAAEVASVASFAASTALARAASVFADTSDEKRTSTGTLGASAAAVSANRASGPDPVGPAGPTSLGQTQPARPAGLGGAGASTPSA